MSQPDYGLDAPKLVRRFAARGILLMAFAAILYFVNRGSSPGIGPLAVAVLFIGAAFVVVSMVMIVSSKVVKIKVCARILDSIPWRGDENVLDVGCGRGLFLIGAAKRLKTGKGHRCRYLAIRRSLRQLRRSNVSQRQGGGRVRPRQSGDSRRAPAPRLPAASFDVTLSSLAIHNIATRAERAKALAEIVRVLKPGGYLAIFDIFHTSEYAKALEGSGFTEIQLSPVTFLWCVPTRTLTARKGS